MLGRYGEKGYNTTTISTHLDLACIIPRVRTMKYEVYGTRIEQVLICLDGLYIDEK